MTVEPGDTPGLESAFQPIVDLIGQCDITTGPCRNHFPMTNIGCEFLVPLQGLDNIFQRILPSPPQVFVPTDYTAYKPFLEADKNNIYGYIY